MGIVDEAAKERCMEVDKKEKKRLKDLYTRAKKEVKEQFGRMMNQDEDGNRKEVSKVYGGKVERCSRIKDGNGSLALGEEEVRRIWKEYEDYITQILNSRLQSRCVASLVFREVKTTSEESKLGELK